MRSLLPRGCLSPPVLKADETEDLCFDALTHARMQGKAPAPTGCVRELGRLVDEAEAHLVGNPDSLAASKPPARHRREHICVMATHSVLSLLRVCPLQAGDQEREKEESMTDAEREEYRLKLQKVGLQSTMRSCQHQGLRAPQAARLCFPQISDHPPFCRRACIHFTIALTGIHVMSSAAPVIALW